jgi:predicted histone-like DNA-binding protein
MKYKVIEKFNPQKPDDPRKWYANPVNSGKITIKELAKEIAGRSSLTRGDIENVLANCIDELPTFLKLGMSVKLGEFGTLRLSIASEGADQKDEFSNNNIKGVRVVFTPSVELKKLLEDIHFENYEL